MAMRPLRSLLSFEEALKVCLEKTEPIERRESVPLAEAGGRVLCEDITASSDVPAFDRAAMDGYAVLAQDTYQAGTLKPAALEVIETLYAGDLAKKKVGPGTCTEVATGVKLPPGADGVVRVEDTERVGSRVSIRRPIHPGQYVSRRGEDVRRGTVVLRAGNLLTPSRVGVLAAVGRAEAPVYERARVHIIASGEEVVEPGQPLADGRVYNINSYSLAAIVQDTGARATLAGIVADDRASIRRAIEEGLDCDVVVFSAGSSVGERDILVDVMQEVGKVLFHGIAVKPGKPTLFGRVGRTLLFGMPGYPTSCLSNAYMMLVPMLRKMMRLPVRQEERAQASLSTRIVSVTGRHQFYTVRLDDGEALPAFKESGAITSMSEADGYIEIPANVDLVEKGEKVLVRRF
ncbi:MAG: molybdopterin-binding protein [Acidobacteria bacterium]|nr:molybdopterin-binding protein [Acidobacteriota bacterium]